MHELFVVSTSKKVTGKEETDQNPKVEHKPLKKKKSRFELA